MKIINDVDIEAVYQNFMSLRFKIPRHQEGRLWRMFNNVRFEFNQNHPSLRGISKY